MLTLAAITIGVHLASHHFPDKSYQDNANPGLYMRIDNVQAGFFRNTLGRTSGYVGAAIPGGTVEFVAGLTTGYQKRREHGRDVGITNGAISPMIAVTYAPNLGELKPRIWVLPPVGRNSAVIHLSIEHSFK